MGFLNGRMGGASGRGAEYRTSNIEQRTLNVEVRFFVALRMTLSAQNDTYLLSCNRAVSYGL